MSTKRVIQTDEAPTPLRGAPYSQAIEAGGFVFVSGQLGLRPGDTGPVSASVEEQTEQVFTNLASVLKAAGTDLSRIVKTTVYLTTLDNFDAMNAVYRRHVDDAPPARATIAAGLPNGFLVEIEAVALA